MLQLPEKQPTQRKLVKHAPSPAGTRRGSALDVIRADIQPIDVEPNLLDTLCWMKDENDIKGMIVLYETFAGIAQKLNDIGNQPRASGRVEDFIDAECERAWAKAYLVADFLKDMRPTEFEFEGYSEILFRAALQMGANFKEAVAVVNEVATWKGGC